MPASGRSLAIFLIVVCQIAAMALWFSASAAVPSLLESGRLSTEAAATLTSAVQIGFVAGTLASAALGLADRFDSRVLFSAAALLGALLNGALLLSGFDHPAASVLRFATGVCMAGVYPVGMKLAAGLEIELGHSSISLVTFLVMATGAIGCLLAGILADRIGRTLTTIGALLLSGGCALLIGLSVDTGPVAVIVIAAMWGMTVVADSAQFSAAIAELAEPRLIGTVLTLQTSLGFLLTAVSIWLIGQIVDVVGWRYAFTVLAIGPLLGALSMMTLRQQPEAIKMAGGRK